MNELWHAGQKDGDNMRLLELRLKSGDLKAAHDFYHGVMGLPIVTESAYELVVQAGGTRLVFEYMAGWQGKYHFAFEVPENQIGIAAEWIEGKATLAIMPDKVIFKSSQGWNAEMVYFYDSEGNILELIARHRQPNASETPFSAHSILSISEIGLATPDVPALETWLCETLGIHVYDPPGSSTFTPVGDELGLFIVVKEGRGWYPETGIPAGLYPVAVTVAGVADSNFDVPNLPYHIQVRSQ